VYIAFVGDGASDLGRSGAPVCASPARRRWSRATGRPSSSKRCALADDDTRSRASTVGTDEF